MKTIKIGNKFKEKHGFRETCFGIVVKDNKLLVVYDQKHNQYSLVGGGIDNGETHEETLKREFIEEIGATIKSIIPFITIDCFWLAGGDYPMESLANFYILEIDEFKEIKHESEYKYIDINKVDLPLPYQKEAIKLFIKKYKK